MCLTLTCILSNCPISDCSCQQLSYEWLSIWAKWSENLWAIIVLWAIILWAKVQLPNCWHNFTMKNWQQWNTAINVIFQHLFGSTINIPSSIFVCNFITDVVEFVSIYKHRWQLRMNALKTISWIVHNTNKSNNFTLNSYRNEAGERLVSFVEENGLTISNTQFLLYNRWLCNWTSLNKSVRTQTDYILIQKRWKSSIKKCRTYTGTKINSDHETPYIKYDDQDEENSQISWNWTLQFWPWHVKNATEVMNKFQVFEKLQLEETIQKKQ